MGQGNFNRSELCEWTSKSIDLCQFESLDVDAVLDDIVKITNLILEEGGDYRFAHKSLQEYHAAVFIKSQSEVKAKKFYSAQLGNRVRGIWAEELRYLFILDKLRIIKYLFLPELRSLLGLTADEDHAELDTRPLKAESILSTNWTVPTLVMFENREGLKSGFHLAGSFLYHLYPKRLTFRLEAPSWFTSESEGEFNHKDFIRAFKEAWEANPQVEESVRGVVLSKYRELRQYVQKEASTIDVFDL